MKAFILFSAFLAASAAHAEVKQAYEGCSVTEFVGSSYNEATQEYKVSKVTANYQFDGSYEQKQFSTELLKGIQIQFYSGPGGTDGHDAYGIGAVITDTVTGAIVRSSNLSALAGSAGVPPNYHGLSYSRLNRDLVSIYCTRFISNSATKPLK